MTQGPICLPNGSRKGSEMGCNEGLTLSPPILNQSDLQYRQYLKDGCFDAMLS